MKKRLISLPEELDKILIEFSKRQGFTVNTVILQQLWKLKSEIQGWLKK